MKYVANPSSGGVYSIDWLNVAPGNYALTAMAYDDLGVVTTSSVVNITVGASHLKGYWTFEEGGGSTTADQSGYGNTGTVMGAPCWEAGILGTALHLNGVSDNVEVPYSNSLAVSNGLTVALWMKSDASLWNTYAGMSKRPSYFLLSCSQDTAVVFDVSIGGIYYGVGSPGGIDIRQWHHYAGTYDGSMLRLYVDGVQVASTACTGNIDPDTGVLCLGRDDGLSRYLAGSIDDARVYDVALSAGDVAALAGDTAAPTVSITAPGNTATLPVGDILITANAADTNGTVNRVEFYNGAAEIGVDVASPYCYDWTNVSAGTYTLTARVYDNQGVVITSAPVTITVTTSHLKGYWAFDETSGSTAIDSSIYGNPGTLLGAPQRVAGMYGNALHLNGVSDDVEVPYSNSLAVSNGLTVALWMKSDASLWNTYAGMSKRPSYFLLSCSQDTAVVFDVSIGGIDYGVGSPGGIDIRQWHHYAGTYDGSMLRLYVDGVQVASTACTGNIDPDTGVLCLGRDNGLSRYLAGSIDDARVYDVALSAGDVAALAGDTVAPTVSITSPANGGTVPAGNIMLAATASDSGGDTISKVEFYQGGMLLGAVTSSPYNFIWSNVSSGSYTLTARAYDDQSVATSSSAVSITVDTSHLKGYWALDETSGTTEIDSSIYGNTGTLQGTPQRVAGVYGNALHLNGSYSYYDGVEVPYSSNMTVCTGVTVALWMKSDTSTWNTWAGMGVQNAFVLQTDNGGTDLTFNIMSGGVYHGVGFTPFATDITQWHHYAATYDGTTLVLYVDGIARGSAVYSGCIDAVTGVLCIGYDEAGYGSLAGSIDDARLYDVALSAGDIAALAGNTSAPTVSITSPGNGVTVPAGDITLSATASDSGGGTIGRVEFYQGGTLLGAVTSSPYTFTWSNVGTGSYTLTAVAYDDQLVATTSNAITITVATSHLKGYWALDEANGTTAIDSSLYGNTGTVQGAPQRVPGLYGNALHLNGSNSYYDGVQVPYSASMTVSSGMTVALWMKSDTSTWNTWAGMGKQNAFLLQTDNGGTDLTFNIMSGGVYHGVGFTPFATDITQWHHYAATYDGTTLLLYVDGVVRGTASYSGCIDAATGVLCIGYDEAGYGSLAGTIDDARLYDTALSASDVAALAGNTSAPTINITAPANNAVFAVPPATVSITAAAADAGGTIGKVEFYQGSVLLGTATASPYSCSWSNVGCGSYVLTAKAYDDQLVATTSTAVNIRVNNPPAVNMTSPANNAVYTGTPAVVTMTATATDTDGTISKVEFYQGSTLVGTVSASPYTCNWSNVAAGAYVLTAEAYDSDGAATTSTVITITVEAQCASPAFNPAPGTYASALNVTISTSTGGATLRYTTDGTTPTETAGTVYSSAVSISVDTTLQAIAYATGFADSAVSSGVYAIQCATPTFNPVAGTYSAAQSVTISTTTGGAAIRYTTDGTTPTETAGTVYSSAVNISVNTTLQAIAYATGYADSVVSSGAYAIQCATPTFNPVAGTYGAAQSVTISSTTGGAAIRYTTDGSTPTETAGTVYSSAVSISVDTTLQAIAYATGYTDSAVSSGVYAIQCATPTFNPVAGTYGAAQSVTISTTTGGAAIRYTTDGSTPTETAGTVYSSAVNISVDTTLKAIAYATGYADSAVSSGVYTIQCAAPSFTPAAGVYGPAQTVTISSTTSGASMRYTTDGTMPSSTSGTVYSSPVSISATSTLQAIAYETGMLNSSVTSGVYTINGACATPTFNPTAGTFTTSTSLTISTTTSGASIRYTTNGTTPSSTVGTVYSSAVSIIATSTLQAIAYETGYSNSAVASGVYTVQCATPTFSPAAGTFTTSTSVTISTATGGASIRYTTNGTTPSSTVGTVYSSAVSITATSTLQAIAYETGLTNSAVASGVYTIQCATPTFNPAADTFTTSTSVTISTATGGASIRYTTNGTMPSSSVGTVYSSAVSIAATATLQAIAYATGLTNSAVGSGVYTIQCAAPTFNPAAGTYTSATVTISTTTSGASIRYTTNGTTPSSTVGTVYSSPMAIGQTGTLQAIAYQTGLSNSTVTSGAYTIYIGTTTVGGTNTAITANEMRGTRFQAGSAMTINHIALDIGTSVSGNIQCAIYSDSSSVPSTLLKGTGALEQPGHGVADVHAHLLPGAHQRQLLLAALLVSGELLGGKQHQQRFLLVSQPHLRQLALLRGQRVTETRTWSIYGY